MAEQVDEEAKASYTYNTLRILLRAFSGYGSWRVTHVEPTGMSHTEAVSAGQLATIAFDALAAEGLLLSHDNGSGATPFVPRTDEHTDGPRFRCFCGAEHMTGACIWGALDEDEARGDADPSHNGAEATP